MVFLFFLKLDMKRLSPHLKVVETRRFKTCERTNKLSEKNRKISIKTSSRQVASHL